MPFLLSNFKKKKTQKQWWFMGIGRLTLVAKKEARETWIEVDAGSKVEAQIMSGGKGVHQ